jgi:hypothetical protein
MIEERPAVATLQIEDPASGALRNPLWASSWVGPKTPLKRVGNFRVHLECPCNLCRRRKHSGSKRNLADRSPMPELLSEAFPSPVVQLAESVPQT